MAYFPRTPLEKSYSARIGVARRALRLLRAAFRRPLGLDFAVFFILAPLMWSGRASANNSNLVRRALDMNDDEKAVPFGPAQEKEPVLGL